VQFTSIPFAYFFLLTLTLTWLVRPWRRVQKGVLLSASYFFYGYLDLRLLALLLVSSVMNWALGEAIAKSTSRLHAKHWLWLALGLNLLTLGFFKYYGLLQRTVESVSSGLGLSMHLPLMEVFVPLGISFYTFQAISYLVDLYRGDGVRAHRLLDFLLFMGFFPKLVAGPITRSRQFLVQITGHAERRIPDLSRAIWLIASGFFKKAFIASFLATRLVEDAFVAPENHSSLELLVALYAYSIQVFCDFSGYTDFARGFGLLLGFELPENFNAPYAATSIGEFWRRWHMTFSAWLRDYVYYPLGGSKGHPLRTAMNLVVTFLICGLWHGANWKFVIWGGIHGVALALHKLMRDYRRGRGVDIEGPQPWYWLAGGWFITFHLTVFARVFFQSPDLSTAGTYISTLFELTGTGRGLDLGVIVVSLIGLGLNFHGQRSRAMLLKLHDSLPWQIRPAVWVAVGLALVAIKPSAVAPFIYFQF